MHSTILFLHIAGGTVGVLSGFAAAFLKKGSRRHGLAGNIFVASMMLLSSTGAYLALRKSEMGNVVGGAMTFYMVTTAWITARRRNWGTSLLDWASPLVAFSVAAVNWTWGLQAAMSATGTKNGDPAWPNFVFATVATLAGVGDIRLLVRGGIAGTQRIARHLWRMCFGLFVASASIFLARPHLFPALLQKTGVLVFLGFLPLLLLIFWMIRVRFTNASKRNGWIAGSSQPSLSAH